MRFVHWSKVNIGAPPIMQRADCTICAIAFLCDMSYTDVDKFLSGHGRDRGRGVSTAKVLEECGNIINGYTFTKVPGSISVAGFVKGHPIGQYLLRIKGHVFALSNGVVYDYSPKPYVHLSWAMQVTDGNSELTLEDIL